MIRRAPYLSNADDLIYKDSQDENIELAYLGKQFDIHVFVEYDAVHQLRDWAKAAVRPTAGGRLKERKHAVRD